jgi:hypothetical protein
VPGHAHVRGPLDVDTVIAFLIDRELLRRREIFDHPVRAVAVSRRNRNLRVTISATRGFFVKQAEPTTDSGVESLRREVAFFADERTFITRRLGHAPTPAWCDLDWPLIVLDLLPTHQGLWDHYRSFAPPRFPVPCYHQLGRILAQLHASTPGGDAVGQPPIEDGRDAAPWVFAAHQPPPGALLNLSPAAAHALAIVQASDVLRTGLDTSRAAWRTDAFIHGDLRADNVLVRMNRDQTTDMRLVDWELARPGDPVWDLAALVQDLLLYWVSGLDPSIPDADIARVVGTARVPWSVLQPAVQALWRSYTTAAGGVFHSDGPASAASEKLATFTAVRAVQCVLEMAERQTHLPPHGVLLLQLAENLLLDPARAVQGMFGIR